MSKLHVVAIFFASICQVSCSRHNYVCSSKTMANLHSNAWSRIDEGSPTYDCAPSNAGGQCVALPKCECNVARTSFWLPGKLVKSNCHGISYGTVIATFDSYSALYGNNVSRDHTAIFLGCGTAHGHNYIEVYEQACAFSIRKGRIYDYDQRYNRFHVVQCDNSHHDCSNPWSNGCQVRYHHG